MPSSTLLEQLSEADQRRASGLRTMRWVATSLLVVAAMIFMATLGRGGAWGYVNAAAEAGMVGALADWFAVTALFRHPLGLKIPHTALVPRRKDMFAQGLEDFVSGHFLTGEAARERLLQAGAVPRGARWLADDEHSAWVVGHGCVLASRVVEHVSDADVEEVVRQVMVPRLAALPVSSTAGGLLSAIVRDRAHTPVVDIVVGEARHWLRTHPTEFMGIVGERLPSWAPSWASTIIADKAYDEALKWIDEVWSTPQHRVRVAVDGLLAEFAEALQQDATVMERLERAKTRMLEHPDTTEAILQVWRGARSALQDALAEEGSPLQRRLAAALSQAARTITEDPQALARVERKVGDVVASLIDTYAGEVAPVITQVISRWDGQEASRRIELHVGRDLQFIRINGTVVGALAGLVIHQVSLWIAH